MLSRHNEEADGVNLPKEWLEEITKVINSAYSDLFSAKNLTLKTYGELHKGEVCIAFCLYNSSSGNTGSISLLLSVDLKDKEDPKSVLDNTIDQSSEFFDLLVSDQTEDIFQPNWVKSQLKKDNFYFKITRENIALSIEANKLLKET
tara:strand:+ start:6276 stop:6716 length:441 start_codon:yes stop_codon:yes gene_type:complete